MPAGTVFTTTCDDIHSLVNGYMTSVSFTSTARETSLTHYSSTITSLLWKYQPSAETELSMSAYTSVVQHFVPRCILHAPHFCPLQRCHIDSYSNTSEVADLTQRQLLHKTDVFAALCTTVKVITPLSLSHTSSTGKQGGLRHYCIPSCQLAFAALQQ